MQMTLAFIAPTDPEVESVPLAHRPIPWDHLDPVARDAAREGLAQLMARMLAAQIEAANHD